MAVDNYWVCLVGILFANAGGGFFGSIQATLVMQALPPEQHGTGMGTMTLAIGAQALGMLLYGQVAEAVTPEVTMLIFAGLGVGSTAVFTLAAPHCWRMEAPRVGSDE